jgi:hypothetical protein
LHTAVAVFAADAGDGSPFRRNDGNDARAGLNLDVGFVRQPPPADIFKQRTRQEDCVESEVVNRERIVSRPLDNYVPAGPSHDGAGLDQVAPKVREQRL